MFVSKLSLRSVVIVPASLVLLLALACGGSDDGDENPTATTGSQQANNPTATTQSSSSSSNIAADTGVVTIGTKTYEFSMADFMGFDRCLTAFGVVAGNGEASDGSDVELNFDIPPVDYVGRQGFEDYDPPSVEVEDKVTGERWAAGGDFSYLQDPPEEDETRVDSWQIDGGVASGTGTFLDMNAYSEFTFGFGDTTERPEPVTGTFELHCGA